VVSCVRDSATVIGLLSASEVACCNTSCSHRRLHIRVNTDRLTADRGTERVEHRREITRRGITLGELTSQIGYELCCRASRSSLTSSRPTFRGGSYRDRRGPRSTVNARLARCPRRVSHYRNDVLFQFREIHQLGEKFISPRFWGQKTGHSVRPGKRTFRSWLVVPQADVNMAVPNRGLRLPT
jgi:hypothetical protein